jgi:YfiH family protein
MVFDAALIERFPYNFARRTFAPENGFQTSTASVALGEMKAVLDKSGREAAPSQVLVQVPAWSAFSWLRHGFSTRHGGVSTVYQPDSSPESDLNLGWTKDDDPANVAVNRLLLVAAATGTAATPLFTLRQIHSATSLAVPDATSLSSFVNSEGRALREADGLITAVPGILLGIQTADCVPVLVADTKNRVVAALHAGWRGTAARIVEQGIAQMVSGFGSHPEDIVAAIGPSIGPCCYTVGEEVHTAFTTGFSYGESLFQTSPDGTQHLDLWAANRHQLRDSGIPSSNITVIGECTGCTGLPSARRYFSHRCEHGFTGRMMNVIGIDA